MSNHEEDIKTNVARVSVVQSKARKNIRFCVFYFIIYLALSKGQGHQNSICPLP